MSTLKTSSSISKSTANNKLNATKIAEIRKRYMATLEALHKELDIPGVVSIGNIRFGADEFHFKFQFTAAPDKDHAMSKDEILFRQLAAKYNMSPDDYGREFRNTSGQLCRVVSINSKRIKYPITYVVVATNERFDANDFYIRQALEAHAPKSTTTTTVSPSTTTSTIYVKEKCLKCNQPFKASEYFTGLKYHAKCTAPVVLDKKPVKIVETIEMAVNLFDEEDVDKAVDFVMDSHPNENKETVRKFVKREFRRQASLE